ncbi:Hypothetical predicted protein [Octopus vulgaris]|uniref:Uncharacterized protein n=1 Tax=Octopus vulgaris TaxID=6645 RepID=A0AA36F1V3_OCTVU|nr:Hypothetical predicted protein [Octopus vulgaris]
MNELKTRFSSVAFSFSRLEIVEETNEVNVKFGVTENDILEGERRSGEEGLGNNFSKKLLIHTAFGMNIYFDIAYSNVKRPLILWLVGRGESCSPLNNQLTAALLTLADIPITASFISQGFGLTSENYGKPYVYSI